MPVKTGDLDIHELTVEPSGRIVFVNTRFSCLATTSLTHGFKPLWKPPFISRLAPEDRCHLNGLAVVDNELRYVSALGTTDRARHLATAGWLACSAADGVHLDLDRIQHTDELRELGWEALHAINPRLVYAVITGYGLEGFITDGFAGETRRGMVPFFREADYGRGLLAGATRLAQPASRRGPALLGSGPAGRRLPRRLLRCECPRIPRDCGSAGGRRHRHRALRYRNALSQRRLLGGGHEAQLTDPDCRSRARALGHEPGRGTARGAMMQRKSELRVALGGFGAYVACSEGMRDYLVEGWFAAIAPAPSTIRRPASTSRTNPAMLWRRRNAPGRQTVCRCALPMSGRRLKSSAHPCRKSAEEETSIGA